MHLKRRVLRTIAERDLLAGGRRLLVGCSGGPDSVALAHVLASSSAELNLHIELASVDHGLRPESADEVAAVGELAERLGCRFHSIRLGLEPGPNVQARAREARYRALLEVRDANELELLAVGHTLDDQAETVLSRLVRGRSTTELQGIRPRRGDGVIRPLLDARRAQVLEHIAHFALPVVQDPSNTLADYERVRYRLEHLPRLASEDPQVAPHLARLADDMADMHAVVQVLAERVDVSGQSIALEVLRDLLPAVRREVLRRFLDGKLSRGVGRSVIDSIEQHLSTGGEVWLPGGAGLAFSSAELRFVPAEPDAVSAPKSKDIGQFPD